jgi:PIN domain nuclease of toxin-antitoxin system
MRVLVDTHAFFWWLMDAPKLSVPARAVFEDENNIILVSSVVAWELSTKVRSGKWPEARYIAESIEAVVEANRFTALPLTLAHARVAGLLPARHRDPFDRMLAAQSQVDGVPLVTADPIFRSFGTLTMW